VQFALIPWKQDKFSQAGDDHSSQRHHFHAIRI